MFSKNNISLNEEWSKSIKVYGMSGELFLLMSLMLTLMFSCTTISPMIEEIDQQEEMINRSIVLSDQSVLKYKESGKGNEHLVFVHGLGSSSRAFEKLTPLLSDDYHCWAIDLYQDNQNIKEYSIIRFVKIIHEFAQAQGIDRLTLIGHSMGGQISIRFAHTHPDMIHKLVLLAPAGIETFSDKDRNWFEMFVSKDFYKTYTHEKVKANFDINFYGDKLPADAQFMYDERIDIMSNEKEYDAYLDYYLGSINAMLYGPVHNILSLLKCEVLVIYGQDDNLIPNAILHQDLTVESIADLAEEKIPNSKIILLEQCGHFVPWDQPIVVAKHIKSF